MIVEDEAEDIRGSQLGAISNDSITPVPQSTQANAPAHKKAKDKNNSMNRDTHSPTPNRAENSCER